MAAFAETVDDLRLRYKLEEALSERKPLTIQKARHLVRAYLPSPSS
jgi:hypothetical protein